MSQPSSLSQLRAIASLPSWWQQLGWMVGAEVIMALLSAWAWSQGLETTVIVLGLAVVSALEGMLIWAGIRLGRAAATVALLVFVVALALSLARSDVWQWWFLCIAIGIIQGFSYLQGIRALAWVSVSARRRRAAPGQTLALASLASGVILAVFLGFAGWVASHWAHLPHLVALLVAISLLPLEWRQTRALSLKRKPAAPSLPVLHWWIGINTLFNILAGLGRRFVVPLVIVVLAASSGREQQGLAWVGGAMGLMGILGLATRQVWQQWRQREHHHGFGLRTPFFLGVAGWLCVAVGLLGWQSFSHWGWAVLMAVGWFAFEVVNRIFAVAHYEGLRLFACHGQINRQRAYREALTRLFVSRPLFMACFFVVAAVLTVPQVAILLLALCAAALILFEFRSRPPSPNPLTAS